MYLVSKQIFSQYPRLKIYFSFCQNGIMNVVKYFIFPVIIWCLLQYVRTEFLGRMNMNKG